MSPAERGPGRCERGKAGTASGGPPSETGVPAVKACSSLPQSLEGGLGFQKEFAGDDIWSSEGFWRRTEWTGRIVCRLLGM